jgi:hypothetical protein
MKTGRGRPLRFLALFLMAWVGARAALLWPQFESAADVLRAVVPGVMTAMVREVPAVAARPGVGKEEQHRNGTAVAAPRWPSPRKPDPTRIALALLGLVRYGDAQPVVQAAPSQAASLLPGFPHPASADMPAGRPPPSRWSGSAWLFARAGSGLAPGGLGGQLGGSQAGVRIAYAVDRKHRLALAGRVSSPLGPGLREAAVGVEWQPTRLPLRLVAEQRFAISGGRGGSGLALVGGVGPTRLPLGFRLDAYGQAGVIRRTTTEAYGDGAVRIAHPLAAIGGVRVDLGAGVWGAAQRGAARLDLGPSLALTVPIDRRSVRLGFDWRARIAGDARPGSGPALTLGADF